MVVLQLGRALKQLQRGSVLRVLGENVWRGSICARFRLQALLQDLAPFQCFQAAMGACGV